MEITSIIEQLRNENNISKSDLALNVGIDVRTYYRYVATDRIPFKIAYKALKYLGYGLSITRDFN